MNEEKKPSPKEMQIYEKGFLLPNHIMPIQKTLHDCIRILCR